MIKIESFFNKKMGNSTGFFGKKQRYGNFDGGL